jgi:hypothetical protein
MAEQIPEDEFFQGLGGVYPPEQPTKSPPVVEAEEDFDEDFEDFDPVDVDDDVATKLAAAATARVREDEALEKYAQRILNRPVTKSNLFSHSEAHPYVLDMALIKTFQLDWFMWSPETLFTEIEKTFHTSIAEVNRLKILVAATLHVSDVFWDQWEVFEKAVLALNGIIPSVTYMQPPDVGTLMTAVDIANSIRKEEFSEEVSRYVAACFLNDHISYAPKPLDFAAKYLRQPRYSCGECGKEGSALPPFDGHCDSCSRKFEDEHAFNFKPHPEAKDDPSKVRVFDALDPGPTKERFEELVKLPADQVKIDETADDIEAAKLINATDYMKFRQHQRDTQFSQIKNWMVQ